MEQSRLGSCGYLVLQPAGRFATIDNLEHKLLDCRHLQDLFCNVEQYSLLLSPYTKSSAIGSKAALNIAIRHDCTE